MPILLKDMKVGMHDKVAEQVVDTFIRHSEVLELLPFDNAVSPSGGSTLTYGYVQTKLPSNTAFRALNTEYTSSEAKLEKKAVDLKVFGGAFEIDRVIKDAEGMYDNMAYQIDEKVISAIGTFHNAMINGDSATNSETFDGLDKFLVGQTTEFNT
ncbi:MAG: phage capsid protein, partial [Solobacterium sp.]|nr:phage capsid protein [Solobacterium sp.]